MSKPKLPKNEPKKATNHDVVMNALLAFLSMVILDGKPMADVRPEIVKLWSSLSDESRQEIAQSVRDDLQKMKATCEAMYQEFLQASVGDL